MKKVIIEHFRSLDNYGTGMMGLVAVQALADRLGRDNVEFHCDFEDDAVMEEVRSELGPGIRLCRYVPLWSQCAGMGRWRRRAARLWDMLFAVEGRGYDMMIVLGGDDFSEYYGPLDAAMAILRKWRSSFVTDVVLLGQTLGPFTLPINRFAVRYMLPRLHVYARDKSSAGYLRENFGTQVKLSADLALSDLPLQRDDNIALQTMRCSGLERDGYFTVVVSAGQKGGKYYARSEETYLRRFAEIIGTLCGKPGLEGKKAVLLAHTFGRYGDEAGYIARLYDILPPELKDRVIKVTEKILPTRARIVLGNGLFTVTGRMHAAVSTFQMGRPAICLSYSAKFGGVVGDSLGRGDMILGADDDVLWESGRIVPLVSDKASYVLDNYEKLCAEISGAVSREQAILDRTLDEITLGI